MAIANDHWYGYVQEVIAEHGARWIECAAASLYWTTQLVFQMDGSHVSGHMMFEPMHGADNRTTFRGNAFSFLMPWEDILKQVSAVERDSVKIPLPHGGAVLAILLRLHITGGATDVTKHIQDFHLRPVIVRRL